MKNILKTVLFLALSATVLTGCTESDKPYDVVNVGIPTYNLTANKDVATVNSAANGTPTLQVNDDIIEAYVTSSDVGGNFYKTISFQTIPEDNSAPIGFSVSIDETMLFSKGFTPGRKVYIKLKDLYIAKVFGSMQIGLVNPDNSAQIYRIPEAQWENHLFISDVVVPEDSFVRPMPLSQAILDVNLNTLIELTSIEFADNSLGRSYYDIDSGGGSTNHDIVDYTIGGRARFFRVSSFAPFSSHNVPSGRGNIRGVMTKYNSDYQFLVRQESDVKLNEPRTYTYFSSLNEDFNGYINSGSSYNAFSSYVFFPNYVNFSTEGTKKWFIKNNMLEMSSFSGNVEKNKAYFMVPVDMTAASTFKFDMNVVFFQASLGLKIYRTTNYVPGMKLSDATLNEISSSFSAALPSVNGTYTNLTYNIPPNVTGNGFIVFEYTGTNISTGPVVTTTIQIDNIVVN